MSEPFEIYLKWLLRTVLLQNTNLQKGIRFYSISQWTFSPVCNINKSINHMSNNNAAMYYHSQYHNI